MLDRNHERGDTIIEVLFAITIFSFVAVGGLSIMNQGVATAQRSLEIGLVRQQMDTQADALRYLNQAYVADYGKRGDATRIWQEAIAGQSVAAAQRFDDIADATTCNIPNGDGDGENDRAFALDVNQLLTKPDSGPANPEITDIRAADTYAKILRDADAPISSRGLWIQAVRADVPDGQPGFYDFHIRACWNSPGQSMPVTLGTIVRLYEPRG